MINAEYKDYNYLKYDSIGDYGQSLLSDEVQGSVRMAIFNSSKGVSDNAIYCTEEYVGLTFDTNINDKCVILMGGDKLKVKYTLPAPRKQLQVFLEKISG